MRKLIAAVALAGTALSLAACSGEAEEATDTTAEVEATDTAEAATTTEGVLDASTATAEQLAAAGLGAEAAAAIVAGQPYDSVSAFHAKLMESMSADEAAAVLETVFVPVNLNSASEADIKLIPGMTEKMEHEFMEYRPYADMDEFNREIGKYVDETEVARFRQYVTL